MVGALQAPINYLANGLADYDVGKEIDAYMQQQAQRQLTQAAQAAALDRQAKIRAAQQRAIADPSAQNYAALQVLDPEHFKDIGSAFNMLDKDQRDRSLQDLSTVRGYLGAGRGDDAIAVIQRRIDADKKAGQDTSDDEEMVAAIRADPKNAAGLVDYQLAGVLGADKWAEAFGKIGDSRRSDAQLPGQIAETAAKTGLTQAQTAKTVEEAAQIAPNSVSQRAVSQATIDKMGADVANAAARLNLDEAKFAADVDLRTRQLDLQEGTLSDGARSAVNSAIVSSQSSRQLANRATSLADQFVASGAKGGVGASLTSMLTGITGDASSITQLRREYQQLRSQQAVKNLPPGPASDKDIQMALKGFPSENADGRTLESFLRGVAKLQNLVADQQDRQAEWLAGNNGSLGPARKGFFVGNDFVAPGTRYDALEATYRKKAAQADAAQRVGAK